MSTIVQDLRFGARVLRRSAGLSLLAILCLTIAIGANAAVYGWIEGILLRPYPLVADQERLFALAGTARGTTGYTGLSWPDLQDVAASSTLIESAMANNITGAQLGGGDRADRAVGGIVSANYFQAIGVRPALGRGFEPGEDVGHDAHPVVVISDQLWRERFAGDPRIVGRALPLDGVPYTIVGVAPRGFTGTFVGYAFQFWVSASQEDLFTSTGYKLEDRGARWIEGMVRLAPGVTRAQAQAELTALAMRLERAYPNSNRGHGLELVPLWKNPFNNAGALFPTLRIAVVVATLVLLIACANVGNLLLVRALARRREMLLRLAIGAQRPRLVRQLLTEGVLLSACAAVGGLLVAYWSRHALVLFFPSRGGVAYHLPGSVDWRVLALSAALCLTAAVLFGLVPALHASNVDLAAGIRATSVVEGRTRSWARAALVVVQVSLSFALLVGAGLLVRSVRGMRGADPGFATRRTVLTSVNLQAAGYDTARARRFEDVLLDAVRTIGGVESAAYVRVPPFSYRIYSAAPIDVPGFDAPPDQLPTAEYDEVGEGYLATLGIPLVAGREFRRSDDADAEPVAIVNQTMAARFWRDADPVGTRLRVKGRELLVVGVARDAKYGSLLERPKPFFYVPLRQSASPGTIVLLLRTPRTPDAVAPALLRALHALDPNLAPGEVITMREQIARTTSPQHAAVTLLEIFGGVALVLAAVGLYGVMGYVVSQSTREFGLRMALGARAAGVVRGVLAEGLALTGIGIVVGGAAAAGLTRWLGDLLYTVRPRDPAVYGTAIVVMLLVSLAACASAAWRAAHVDPLEALRCD